MDLRSSPIPRFRRKPTGEIFDRTRLSPGQLRTVANRRFDDAKYLRNSGNNARANGAMYLAGFVLECLLKARLLERYSWLQSHGRSKILTARRERVIWDLCYRSHDLAGILECLPELRGRFDGLGQREGNRLWQNLTSICGQWTIFARYSPKSANITEAGEFLDQIKEIKEWLS